MSDMPLKRLFVCEVKMSSISKFTDGAVIILLGALMGWLVGLIATSFLKNSTGGYDSSIVSTLAPLLTPILMAVGVITGILVMLSGVRHAK